MSFAKIFVLPKVGLQEQTMNHGPYQLPRAYGSGGVKHERHSGTSVFRGWVALGFGPPRLTLVSRQGRRDLQECPGLESREWNTQ